MKTNRSLRRSKRSERGAVLYMALLVLIPLAALTYGMLSMGMAFNSERLGSIEDEQAMLLADAGLDEGLLALRAGASGAIGSQAAPVFFGRGLYWVEVSQVGNDLFLLDSNAMFGSGRVSLQRLVFRNFENGLGMTIFSSDDLVLESQVFVDSFDSALGSYVSQLVGGNAGDGAIIESNGDITIDPSAEINGDLHAGPDGSVSIANSADLSGNQQPNPSERTLDPVTIPPIPLTGSLSVLGPRVLGAGDYNFSSITIGTGAALTVSGPARIIVDDFTLASNANLILDTASGPIEFYISGDFVQASNSSIVTTSMSAADMRMNFTGDSTQYVELSSNSDFYGVIYAPEATVEVSSNFEIFGSLIAQSLIINANARIHYDEALMNAVGSNPVYQVATWNVVDFPVNALRINRTDPFRLLGVDSAALDLPEEGRVP